MEMEKKNPHQKYFDYLERLRESGETNMLGAVPYLQRKFPELGFDRARAREIHRAWMDSYKEDKPLTANSFYIIDDAKQRDKMTEEFYLAVRKEIAEYQERADYLIKSGSRSPAILERWVLKIAALEEKKRHYEGILRRELDGLDDEFGDLKLLSQELTIRARGLRAKKNMAKAA